MLLVYLSCAWVVGTFLGANLSLPLTLPLAGLLPLPLLFFRRQRRTIALTSLGLFTLLTAATYTYFSLHRVDENRLHFYNGRALEVRGIVASDPEVGDRGTRLNLSATSIRLDAGWRAVEGTARLSVPSYPAYQYGDVLTVTGRLETPSRLGDFDYEAYLAHQGIRSTMAYPRAALVDSGKGNKLMAWVYSLRGHFSRALGQALPEPQASLAQGLILGLRSNIPATLKSDFYRTGTTHILAISGMNLSIVAGILLALGIWLFGRRHFIYIWLALVSIWLYSLLTGMQPPVVRAAIMASLFLAAELVGRQRSAITALAFAAAIMVGLSPYVLWDVSFQLSFLAMAGLVFVYPTLQTLGRRLVKATLGEDGLAVSFANSASDGFSVSLAATIAVWPAVADYFGAVSFIGPLATVLALPALPGIIITGAVTGVVGIMLPPAAMVLGWFAWPFLSYMILVVGILARPAPASLEVGTVNSGLIWAYYFALAAAFWGKASWQKLRPGVVRLGSGALNLAARLPPKWIIPPLLIAAITVSAMAATMPDDRLHVSFLDVGEGDAILIHKGHRQVLVDGGPSPQAIGQALGRRMPFWDRTIDLLVLTHPHSDHLAGLVEVLRRFQVAEVLDANLDYKSAVYDEWLRLIAAKGIRRTTARNGQRIDLGGGVAAEVLYPAGLATIAGADLDDRSLILRLDTGNISFLLTADAMQAEEGELVRQRTGLISTVLKVAHHGSATSTTPGFLAVADPRIAVVSVGAGNQAGHPSDDVMKRLEDRIGPGSVYRTDENGTIDFITDGRRLWVNTEREQVTK